MIDLILELVAFGLRVLLVGGLVLFLILVVARLIDSRTGGRGTSLSIRRLNDDLDSMSDRLRYASMSQKERKAAAKRRRKEVAARIGTPRAKLYILDFTGDMQATEVESLRDEITLLLNVMEPSDKVLVRVESSGGLVHAYGLAAAQLLRIREAGNELTVCIDRVAASGGYLMACVAHRIVAAPFAIVGSIGVMARVPNLHRLLERAGVDYEEMTAGEYKSTVTLFGQISPEGRRHFKSQLEDTHDLFKSFISRFRPELDIEAVATGEYWYGEQALGAGLIDQLGTSDDLLLEATRDQELFHVAIEDDVPLPDRLSRMLTVSADGLLRRWLDRAEQPRLP